MLYAFDSRLAERYGVDEAIFLHNLCFWVTKNQQDGRNFHDGYTWTYNSIEAFRELFPFWTRGQIRRIIHNLQEKGAIHIGRYNAAGYDRTYWYTLDETVLSICSNLHMDVSKSAHGCAETCTPIPDRKPYRKPDGKPDTAEPKNKNERRESYEFSTETAGGDQAAGGDPPDLPLFL